MIVVDVRSRTPIYEQIKEQVMSLIQAGVFSAHDQLPSIRNLARELDLNVNTVKRAFSELEQDGVIYSLPGRGNYVSENAFANEKIREKALKDLKTELASAKSKGVTWDDVEGLLSLLYTQGETML